MKNEEKIIKLLTKSIRKTDQILKLMNNRDRKRESKLTPSEIHLRQLEKQLMEMHPDIQAKVKHSEQMKASQKKTRDMEADAKKFQRRMQMLNESSRKQRMKNDMMLKKILLISRRPEAKEEIKCLFG
jgi:hypothetical protein